MTSLIRLLTVLLVLTAALPSAARAQLVDVSQAMTVEVMPGWRRDDGSHVAGLRFRLAPGWKTYWRSAGSAGISPQMDWRESRGVRSVTPAWPTPSVFRQGDAISIGYATDFVLPLIVAPRGGTAELRGRLDFGVCAEVCLPARIDVAMALPAAGTSDPAIAAALRDRPRRIAARARCVLRPIADGFDLSGEIHVPAMGRDEAVVFEIANPDVWITDAAVRRSGGRIDATAQMLISGNRTFPVDRSRMRITVVGSQGAVEIVGCTG